MLCFFFSPLSFFNADYSFSYLLILLVVKQYQSTHCCVFFFFNCCSGEDDGDAAGDCEVKPPQSWCMIYPKNLEYIASVGTTCTANATQQVDRINVSESSNWELSDVGKLN